MNILIVDEDVMVQQTCQAMLKQFGHTSIGVQNAVDAVKRLTETPLRFDLVILDNGLPELSGIELLNVLREWNLSIPVILISTNRPHPEIEELMEGFSNVQFLAKPFSMEALRAAIQSSQA